MKKEYNEKTFPYRLTAVQNEFVKTVNSSPDAEIVGYDYSNGDITFYVKGTVTGKETEVTIPKEYTYVEKSYDNAIAMIAWLSDMF